MKRTIKDIDVKNKKVFLRVDFSVPLDENLNITDDTRIVKELPTIKYLLSNGAKLIICSHLGRPDGKVKESLSLLPVARKLIELLPMTKVKFAGSAIGEETKKMANNLKAGEILLLENIRFYDEEEKNDPFFAKKLADLAEIYVNDAFATAHRQHASIYGIAKLLPNAVGFLMGKEINTILDTLENSEKPFVAVLGGSKISDKIYVVMNLINKADTILIGGGMAYTFLKAKGCTIGQSIYDETKLEFAKNVLDEAEKRNVKLILPVDHKCSAQFSQTSKVVNVRKQNIPDNLVGLDIGPKTARLFAKHIKNAKTVIWNGPMGVFEFENYAAGTEAVAKAMAACDGKTIVGGGDSVAAIKHLKLEEKITHVSTGGGASLNLLEGTVLPGVEVIEESFQVMIIVLNFENS